MSALAALARTYDRLAERKEVPSFRFSTQNIAFVISLNADGTLARPPIDLRISEGRKRVARAMAVPQPVKRTSGIAPNFLWDKSAYVLGVTAGKGKRAAAESAAFLARHEEWLAGTSDEGLNALLLFLHSLSSAQFAAFEWPNDIEDQNLVFALERERLAHIYLHDRPEARERWARLSEASDNAVCLITGQHGPMQRLHPSIKGVWGAQTAGASIISFNLDAFKSYGHEQGANAPVCETAAFAYTTVLNRFLERDSGHRLQIGDTSTVFWAEGIDAAAVVNAEDIFADLMGIAKTSGVKKLGSILAQMRSGQELVSLELDLPKDVGFHVLGLAPNGARLSLRFYIEDTFEAIVARYLEHIARMRIVPQPSSDIPSIWRMLIETAVLRKSENIQPILAGEWFRAILTGAPYPLTLLSTLIMRIRADHDVNAQRVAILKSVLIRNFGLTKEAPVSLDPTNTDKGYLLGRLFATYEHVQRAALGHEGSATIKSKFYATASAQPRKVFALLDRTSAYHLSRVGEHRPAHRANLEKLMGGIMGLMSPGADPFPAGLPNRSQALFALGYYHQRAAFFTKAAQSEAEDTST